MAKVSTAPVRLSAAIEAYDTLRRPDDTHEFSRRTSFAASDALADGDLLRLCRHTHT